MICKKLHVVHKVREHQNHLEGNKKLVLKFRPDRCNLGKEGVEEYLQCRILYAR